MTDSYDTVIRRIKKQVEYFERRVQETKPGTTAHGIAVNKLRQYRSQLEEWERRKRERGK